MQGRRGVHAASQAISSSLVMFWKMAGLAELAVCMAQLMLDTWSAADVSRALHAIAGM